MTAAAAPSPAGRWVPVLLRAGSHATVWTLVAVPTVIEMAHGWRATRDDAMIAIGASRVFSSHSPTLGAWSQASQGMRHAFYDLGPLLFWLLAVPVHLDTGQGAIWAAGLLCGGAFSLAVEAAWSIRGWPACVVVALVAGDVAWQTQLFADLVWNPHFGLVFMMATVVTAWAVAAGRFGWWPVTVLLASVAAQCHLLYAVPSVALAVLAPVLAWTGGYRPVRWRFGIVGLLVGVGCWVVPLVQEAVGRPGNISLILDAGSARPRVGVGFGLHALSSAVGLPPVWLTAFPFLSAPQFLDDHGVAWAVVSLVVVAAIALGARFSSRRELCGLAVVGLVMELGAVFGFSTLPKDDVVVVGYLAVFLWVVGALVWVVVLWGAGEMTVAAWRRLHPVRERVGGPAPWAHVPELVGLALLVVGAVEGVRTLVPAAHARTSAVQFDRPLDDAIARSVERVVAPGPVVVTVRPTVFGPGHGDYVIDEWGVAFALLGQGWQPALTYGFFGVATHLSVPPGSHWPHVTVSVDPSHSVVTGVGRTAVGP